VGQNYKCFVVNWRALRIG